MNVSEAIAGLVSADGGARGLAAAELYRVGSELGKAAAAPWRANAELAKLLLYPNPEITVGVAVAPEAFARIRAACGNPSLSDVPPDQDAQEFELHFPDDVALDILTSRDVAGSGAMARYLQKFEEGIQQIEFRCTDIDRATALLRENFNLAPIYPQTRPGADGTRVNFFLVPTARGKVLIELYERRPPES